MSRPFLHANYASSIHQERDFMIPEASDVAAEASIFLSAGALAAVAVACRVECHGKQGPWRDMRRAEQARHAWRRAAAAREDAPEAGVVLRMAYRALVLPFPCPHVVVAVPS
eukprot:CAMPEP_0173097254 /NCGR_PEP_ID=MMETSP1102-20130122/33711_1 /TAXON_ID=49646 /ORGANISM="Geminigera sp., Strain Caron Lab Isolate" /LENGTH=111 /DNA_ID=CAMNT_0013988895 /DNA_START=84 /DNA_END=419 /DNA_ORIENTATION=-